MKERFRPRTVKQETADEKEFTSKMKRLGASALVAGTLVGGAIFSHASHSDNPDKQPWVPVISERARDVLGAYESVGSVEDMFQTDITAVEAGEPGFYEDYPGREVPSLEVDLTSQMTELAKKHEKVLLGNEPELEWQHRIAALNTFMTSDGKTVKFRQPSWPLVEEGRPGTTTKEEPLLIDSEDDDKFHLTIPLGQPGLREMAIVEKLSILPNGITSPTGDFYPMKDHSRVVKVIKLRVGEDGSVKIEKPEHE